MAAAKLTNPEARRRYREDLIRRGLAPGTIKNHVTAVRRFLAWSQRSVHKVSRAQVRTYLAGLADRVLAQGTVALHLTALRGFFGHLFAEGLLTHDPTEGVPRPAPGSAEPLWVTVDQVERLLVTAVEDQSPLGQRDLVLVELLYSAGLRTTEACRVLVGDVSLKENEAALRLPRRAKDGEAWALPLPERTRATVARYLREAWPELARGESRHLLLSATGRPLTRATVWRRINCMAERAGVRVHPHALRRALANQLVQAGAPLPAVQRVLGHQRLRTTQAYVAEDLEALRKAMEGLYA